MNDYQFKVVKIKGDFVWHSHEDTDEVFIVMEGSMVIDFRDKQVTLSQGDMYVVPRGVEHKPYAEVLSRNSTKIIFRFLVNIICVY